MKRLFFVFFYCLIVIIIISSCTKERFEESSTVRNYDGINVTIKQNSVFERELKITYEKQFTNAGYIDAITGEIYEWPYR